MGPLVGVTLVEVAAVGSLVVAPVVVAPVEAGPVEAGPACVVGVAGGSVDDGLAGVPLHAAASTMKTGTNRLARLT